MTNLQSKTLNLNQKSGRQERPLIRVRGRRLWYEMRGKRKGPDNKEDGPPPIPPVPLPGGQSEQQAPPDPERPRVPDGFDAHLRDIANSRLFPGGGSDVDPRQANERSRNRYIGRNPPGTPPSSVQPSWDENRAIYDRKFGEVGDGDFVRVHTGKGSKMGEFIMPRSEFESIMADGGAEALKDRYALPETPKFVTPVKPGPGVDARIGTAAANSYGRGGGIQIELPTGLNPDWFGEPSLIGKEK